jgi:hypothetical protein
MIARRLATWDRRKGIRPIVEVYPVIEMRQQNSHVKIDIVIGVNVDGILKAVRQRGASSNERRTLPHSQDAANGSHPRSVSMTSVGFAVACRDARRC